ncbi:aminomethyltransferase [Methyloceanibacter stevinii]|uniref:Aminomethyltransferase n=1 Tax=Methyloceanibacter stevinii TaxID=1774970 RepID=A0A1E3VTK2_9HYPH|nr:aminomethyltransferase family protein [Methyloceanibacter stevinii]ODR96880.1 aminomethyltransferase [Methyloceanibacter stevinii]
MSTRNSALNSRHEALGSKLDGETWCDMRVPWSYATDPNDEVVAVRTCAGLYDVSALNIVRVTGPDAVATLNGLVAIDVSTIAPGTARLGAEVNENGALVDDIMIICDGPDEYRVTHGSGATPEHLKKVSAGKNVSVEWDRDTHVLSLQGPASLKTLNPHTPMALETLPFFNHAKTTLFGKDVIIGRCGYSGERGYEVYCSSADAGEMWDSILAAGKEFGVVPASWTSLDLIRVESTLLFFPYDMPEGDTTPWEVNMGWGIDEDKQADYIGKQAVLSLRGRERVKQAGIVCDTDDAVEPGTRIFKDGKDVGVVTSSSFSRYLMKSLAMVHLLPDCTGLGTQVTLGGEPGICTGTVVRTPFYDPMRLRVEE